MHIQPELLEILVCPENHLPVSPAPDSLIADLNQQILAGRLKNRKGDTVSEKLDGGLIRQDGKVLYPVREDIPVMLIDEAILL